VRIKRGIGCEYLNARMDLVVSWIPCNHDDTLILRRSNIYATKYVTKPQERVDTNAVADVYSRFIDRSFTRRGEAEDANPDMDDTAKGNGRMCSLLYHYTNVREICNTMAIYYLLVNMMAFFQSHDYTNLVLASGIATAHNVDQV
jgi:hypothetical protein